MLLIPEAEAWTDVLPKSVFYFKATLKVLVK